MPLPNPPLPKDRPTTVNQPTAAPTNKLTAATLSQAVLQLVWIFMRDHIDVASNEMILAVYQLVALFITFGIAYMIPDTDNTPEAPPPAVTLEVGPVHVEKK